MKRFFLFGCLCIFGISNSFCAPSEVSQSEDKDEETLEPIRNQSSSDSTEDGFLKLVVLESPVLLSEENADVTKKSMSRDILSIIPDQIYQQLERPPLEENQQDLNDISSKNFVSPDDRWVAIARMILVPLRGYVVSKFPMMTPLVIGLAVKMLSCFGRIIEMALTSVLSKGGFALLPGKFVFCKTSLAVLKKILGLLQVAGTGLTLLYSVGNKSLDSSGIHDTLGSSWTWKTNPRSSSEESRSLGEHLVHQGLTMKPQVYPVIEKSQTSSENKTELIKKFMTDWTYSRNRTHLINHFHDTTWTFLEDFILNPLRPFTGMNEAEFRLAKARIATWSKPVVSNILESLMNLLLTTYDILENLITGVHTDPKINFFYEQMIHVINDLPPDTTMNVLSARVSNHLVSNWHEIRDHPKLLVCYENLIGFLKMIPGYWKISHVIAIGNAISSHYRETLDWVKSCLTNLFELSTKTTEHKLRSFHIFLSAISTLPRVLSELLREKMEFLAKTILGKMVSVKERLLKLFDLKGLVRSFSRAWAIIVELCLDSLRSLILPLRTLDPLPALFDVTEARTLTELKERTKLASFWEAGLKLFSSKYLEKPLMPLKDLIGAGNLVQQEVAKILVKSFEFFLDLIYVILEKFQRKKVFSLESKSLDSHYLDQSCESLQDVQGHFKNVKTSSNFVRLEETRKESLEETAETYCQSNIHDPESECHDVTKFPKISEINSKVSNARSQWLTTFFRSVGSTEQQGDSTPLSRWVTRFTSRLKNGESNSPNE